MKLETLACLTGSAAMLLFSGCATEHEYHHASRDSYRGTYAAEPVFVERRSVLVENRQRVVPVYRTGETYFYTYNNRRYTLTDPPTVRRTTTTVSRPSTRYVGASYRDVNLDDDYTARTYVPASDGTRRVTRSTTTTVQPERRVRVSTY
jgi:hypothetical protein